MGSVISGIFGGNSSSSSSSNLTAQDILPEAKSADPEAPILGGSSNSSLNTNGKDSLLIDTAAKTKKATPTSYSKSSIYS
jgi:hypothetical protein